MRCHAYQLPSELYRELEAQLLESLANSSLEQLNYLLGEHDLKVELLSGEWRVLFDAARDLSYQVVDPVERRSRMAVSPEELADFVQLLRDPVRQSEWAPISFGLAELVDALPAGVDLVGLVMVEEGDDWLWSESTHEIIAIRPEVYSLIEPHMRKLIEIGDYGALARLCGDHCEGAIEFSNDKWLAHEVVSVARAEGVRLEAFNGFDPAAFLPGAPREETERSFDEMVAHNRRSAKTHSGIWRDLAVRKRRTEVDAQLGPIAAIGREHGLATPITARIIALIHEIEEGRRSLDTANLEELGHIATEDAAASRGYAA